MRIYRGIGPERGRVIYGDEAAWKRLLTEIGLEPIAGWEDIAPWWLEEYRDDMLDQGYSGNWIIYNDEDEYAEAAMEELYADF